jgi:hypothetical protein
MPRSRDRQRSLGAANALSLDRADWRADHLGQPNRRHNMSTLVHWFLPTHPFGFLLIYPAVALWTVSRWKRRGLLQLSIGTTCAIVVVATIVARSDSVVRSLLFFGLTFGLPALVVPLWVAFGRERSWSDGFVYLSAAAVGSLAWMAGIGAALALVRPWAGMA